MRKQSTTEENFASTINCVSPWRVVKVQPLTDYKLEVEFVDGLRGVVELRQLIMGDRAGVFAVLKNIAIFNQVFVSYGAVTWPGEIDLAPDAMYENIKRTGKSIFS